MRRGSEYGAKEDTEISRKRHAALNPKEFIVKGERYIYKKKDPIFSLT